MRPSLESGRFLGSGESDEEKRRAGRAVVESRCRVETAGLGFRKMEVFRGGFEEWAVLGAGLGRFRFVGGREVEIAIIVVRQPCHVVCGIIILVAVCYMYCIAAFCVMSGLGVAELAYPCLIDIRIHTTPFRNKMMSRR